MTASTAKIKVMVSRPEKINKVMLSSIRHRKCNEERAKEHLKAATWRKMEGNFPF